GKIRLEVGRGLLAPAVGHPFRPDGIVPEVRPRDRVVAQFFLFGEVKELPTHCKDAGLQIRGNAVAGNHEEADGFTGAGDLADDLLPPERIASQKWCHINDGDSLDRTHTTSSLSTSVHVRE